MSEWCLSLSLSLPLSLSLSLSFSFCCLQGRRRRPKLLTTAFIRNGMRWGLHSPASVLQTLFASLSFFVLPQSTCLILLSSLSLTHAQMQTLIWNLQVALSGLEVLKVEVYDHKIVGRNRYYIILTLLYICQVLRSGSFPMFSFWGDLFVFLACFSSDYWGCQIWISVKWFQRENRVWTWLSSPRKESSCRWVQ